MKNPLDKMQEKTEKLTAVEWLINEWLYLDQQFDMCLIDRNIYWDKLRQIQEQAKEMEKEQSIKIPDYNLDDLANKANGYLYCDSKKEHKALAFDDGYKVGFQKAIKLLTFKSE